MDGADGHGAFGANGGHQAGGRGPGPMLLDFQLSQGLMLFVFPDEIEDERQTHDHHHIDTFISHIFG